MDRPGWSLEGGHITFHVCDRAWIVLEKKRERGNRRKEGGMETKPKMERIKGEFDGLGISSVSEE